MLAPAFRGDGDVGDMGFIEEEPHAAVTHDMALLLRHIIVGHVVVELPQQGKLGPGGAEALDLDLVDPGDVPLGHGPHRHHAFCFLSA